MKSAEVRKSLFTGFVNGFMEWMEWNDTRIVLPTRPVCLLQIVVRHRY